MVCDIDYHFQKKLKRSLNLSFAWTSIELRSTSIAMSSTSIELGLTSIELRSQILHSLVLPKISELMSQIDIIHFTFNSRKKWDQSRICTQLISQIDVTTQLMNASLIPLTEWFIIYIGITPVFHHLRLMVSRYNEKVVQFGVSSLFAFLLSLLTTQEATISTCFSAVQGHLNCLVEAHVICAQFLTCLKLIHTFLKGT